MRYLVQIGDVFGKYFAIVFDLKSWLFGGAVDPPLISFHVGPFCIMYQWRKLINVGEQDE